MAQTAATDASPPKTKKLVARHCFEQDGIYHALYGTPLDGRGHHSQQALIEDAAKWIHEGGLEDPLQSAE